MKGIRALCFWAVTAVREWCIRPVGREGFGHLE